MIISSESLSGGATLVKWSERKRPAKPRDSTSLTRRFQRGQVRPSCPSIMIDISTICIDSSYIFLIYTTNTTIQAACQGTLSHHPGRFKSSHVATTTRNGNHPRVATTLVVLAGNARNNECLERNLLWS